MGDSLAKRTMCEEALTKRAVPSLHGLMRSRMADWGLVRLSVADRGWAWLRKAQEVWNELEVFKIR